MAEIIEGKVIIISDLDLQDLLEGGKITLQEDFVIAFQDTHQIPIAIKEIKPFGPSGGYHVTLTGEIGDICNAVTVIPKKKKEGGEYHE